jgi:magnesium chelatase family protein
MIEEFLNSNFYICLVGIAIFLLYFIYTKPQDLKVSNCIDIQIEVVPVEFDKLSSTNKGESSSVIRERVIKAREMQIERFKDTPGVYCNAQMNTRLLNRWALPDNDSIAMLKTAMERFNLSARAYDRILKVARTIADLEGSENIQFQHIAEAIGYRNLDRSSWGA